MNKRTLSLAMTLAAMALLSLAVAAKWAPARAASNAGDCARELKQGREALNKRYGKLAVEIYGRLLKNCPVTAETLAGLGTGLKLDGKPKEARPYLEQALEKDPANELALVELGEIYTWNDAHRPEGIDFLRTALSKNANSRRAQKLLGITLSWNESTRTESVKWLTQYVEKEPKDREALLALARALTWSGQADAAEPYYKRALQLDSKDADATYELAMLISAQTARRDEALALVDRALELKPNNLQARFAKGMITAWAGRNKEAIPLLRKLKEEHPDLQWQQGTGSDANLTISLALARVLSWSREYYESEQLLREILGNKPDYLAAKRELGMLLSYQYARRKEAIPILTDVVEKDPKDKEAKVALAQAHIAMQFPEKAEPLLSSVLEEEPEHALALKTRGNLHLAVKKPEKAVQDLEKARSLGLFDADTANALANSYLTVNKPVEAESTARAGLAEGAEDPRLQLTLAKALIKQRKTEEGLNLLRRQSDDPEQRKELAKISYEFAGPNETRPFSTELCSKVLADDPNNTHCLWTLGKVLSWSDKTREEALKHLARHAELKPDDIEARRYYGEVLSWTGKKREALRIYEDLLKLEPDNLNVQASRAQVLSWMGKLGAAIKQYESILAINPKHKEAFVGLGQCLNWQGDNLKAEKVFDRARAVYPDAPDVVLEQSLNYQRLGRVDLALQGAQRTIELFDQEGNI